MGYPLAAGVSIEGDEDVPVIVRIEPLDSGSNPPPTSPQKEDGALVVRIASLAPGDYRVIVEPAVRMPDVRAVWDLVTVVDPAGEALEP